MNTYILEYISIEENKIKTIEVEAEGSYKAWQLSKASYPDTHFISIGDKSDYA